MTSPAERTATQIAYDFLNAELDDDDAAKKWLVEKISAALEEAEQEAMKLVTAHAPYRTARLCGNSIAQDRRFLFNYMPLLESYLHYRQVDVSSLKELALWWHNVKFTKPEGAQHTALFDIRQSIAELKFYRQNWVRP